MNTWDGSVESFLNVYNLEFKCEFLKNDYYFQGDTSKRDIYRLTIIRKNDRRKKLSVNFGTSLSDSSKGIQPTAYHMLSCIAKCNPGSFEYFCKEYGYSIETPKDLESAKIYYKNMA